MDKTLSFFICMIALMGIAGCNADTSVKPSQKSTGENEITGVSIWDRISTRSEPRRSSESTTLLSLGESFYYLDSSAIDSAYNNTEFLKVRLSDSSVVWVYGFASVLNAKPAVIIKEVPLYLRPDLLTITSETMKPMDIVAVVQEWDGWINIVGEKKEKKGWVKSDFITYDSIDLAFALYAGRKLEDIDPEQKIEQMEDLLENNPYAETTFITEIKDQIEKEKELERERFFSRDQDENDRFKNNWDRDRNGSNEQRRR